MRRLLIISGSSQKASRNGFDAALRHRKRGFGFIKKTPAMAGASSDLCGERGITPHFVRCDRLGEFLEKTR